MERDWSAVGGEREVHAFLRAFRDDSSQAAPFYF
jgi:hypothetical protein